MEISVSLKWGGIRLVHEREAGFLSHVNSDQEVASWKANVKDRFEGHMWD